MTATREEIFGYISSGNTMKLEMNFPCHTHAVKRHIKLATEASSLVIGSEAGHELSLSRIKSRRKHPKLESKKDMLM